MKNECCFCSKKFTRKSYYDKHVLICEIINKTSKQRKLEIEEYEETPNISKLYEIIIELSDKYNKLKNKVDKLSNFIYIKKNINIIQLLNNTYKSCEPFEKWIYNIKVERKHLEYIFNYDFVYASLQLFKEFFDNINKDNIPIRSYEQKDNVLYIYSINNSWCEMTQIQFDKIIDFISKQFLHEFVLWQNENKHLMYDDNYAITYMKNVKKINGGNYTTEQLYNKIHKELYKNIKSNINIIHYDIVT